MISFYNFVLKKGNITLLITIIIGLFCMNNIYNDECKYYKFKEQYIILHNTLNNNLLNNTSNNNLLNNTKNINDISNNFNYYDSYTIKTYINYNSEIKNSNILVERIYCNNLTTKNYINFVIILLCIISGILYININQ